MTIGPSAEEYVAALPRRTAHAVHALIEAGGPYAHGIGVLTAAEVCVYDAEAVSPTATGAALAHARQLGLAVRVGPNLWTPTNQARNLRAALEDRYLRETEREGDVG